MTASDRSMRRSIVFATDLLDGLVELSRDAEASGFHRVYTTEFPGRDAVARALAIGLGTERIGVATGIAYAFTRSPLEMAALAADVQRLTGGRFAIGLGSGTRGIRRLYGTEIDRAATWLSGYVAQLRRAWGSMPELSASGPPPVLGAALNPTMARIMARACDGVLLHPLALLRAHLVDRVLPAIRAGEQAGSEPSTVSAWCITAIDRDRDAAREVGRRQAAFYLSTPSYASVVEGTPWDDVAAKVRTAFDASDRRATWASLAPLVPDALLDEIALTGTPEEVADQAEILERELGELGIDELVLQTVGAELDDAAVLRNCAEIIQQLAPGADALSRGGSR